MKRTLKQSLKDAAVLLRSDIREAKWAIIIIIAYFVLSRIFFFGTCPMVILTGFPCPACGLSRAGILLLQLDLAGAWQMNPFIYAIVLYVLCFALRRYMFLRQGGKIMTVMGILLILSMTLFYIWRMMHVFPGEPPMSYYTGNLLHRIGL